MTTDTTSSEHVRHALDAVKKSERNYKLMMGGVFLWELILLSLVVLYMDFSNDLHVLILIATLVMYGTVGIGFVALGAFNQRNTVRILRAIDSSAPRMS